MSELSLLYAHNNAIGYGRLGVQLSVWLKRLGVDVYDDLGDPPKDLIRASESVEREGRSSKRTNVVSWVSVPTHARWWYEGQFSSIFTMWEATVLPPGFRDNLHEFDLVIVPSLQNLELFGRYHDNVRFVPLGVDPERWHYVERQPPDRTFNFMCNGAGERKGVDLAFEAFKAAFADWKPDHGPEPHLILKNPKLEPQYRGHKRVEMIGGKLSSESEVALYAHAHCYVQPSRGEGFGLQPLQAMAQGIPTILTNAHGHDSFAKYGHPVGYTMKPSSYFIFGDAGDWWEPNLDEIVDYMRAIYSNYGAALAKAKDVAKNVIPHKFTWDHCAKGFRNAHDGELDKPYSGSGEYHVPMLAKFLVRVSRPWDAEIAGLRYIWMPGQDYYETADVKRVLYERGVLDPSCIDGDEHGMLPPQMDRLADYTAAKSWCPTCKQRLNSGEQLADYLESQ